MLKRLKLSWLVFSTLGASLLLAGCGQPTQDSSSAPTTLANATTTGNSATTAALTTISSNTSQVQTIESPLSKTNSALNPTSAAVTPAAPTKIGTAPTRVGGPLPIGQALKTVADIPLPGNTTRFDYQSFDPQTGKLFISHLGDSQLVVFDTRSNQIVTTVDGLGEIHGVLVVPELGKVFVTATSDHQLVELDEASLKVTNRWPAGDYPDGLAYDPLDHKIYVSDEGGVAEPVIDLQANRALPSISIGGGAGNTQYDLVSQHIFVDEQDHNELVEIDPKTDKVVTRYPLPGCRTAHSLQLNPAQRLAFVTCEGNAKLLVLDMQDGMRLLTTQDVGGTPDVLALDSERYLLYVACESGNVSIFNVSRPTIQKLGDGFLAATAHTLALDPRTHRVYLPLENVGGKPVLRIMEATFS